MSTEPEPEPNPEPEIECKIPKDLPHYVCIEYPGRVSNIDKAIETLGGTEKIQQTFTEHREFMQSQQSKVSKKKSPKNKSSKNEKAKTEDEDSANSNTNAATTKAAMEPYLELHLNPHGVFDHALFGKIRTVQNCLLIKKTTKIRKSGGKKRKLNEMLSSSSTTSPSPSPSAASVNIEVVGRISNVVTYDELADFQVFTDLKYPKSSHKTNNSSSNQQNVVDTDFIRKNHKRQKIWSLQQDDISNISLYPLIPEVFGGKAQANDTFIAADSSNAKSGTDNESGSQQKWSNLETKPLEIKWSRKKVPTQPDKKTVWRKYLERLNELTSATQKKTSKSKPKTFSFCEQIRGELILQIRRYFQQKPIWMKHDLILQPFYVKWNHIRYSHRDANKQQENKDKTKNNEEEEEEEEVDDDDDVEEQPENERSCFYDYDIASYVFMKKKQLDQPGDASNNHSNHPQGKIFLNVMEKEKLMYKFVSVVAYKFTSGPFRNSWIRFGFDPRDKLNKNVSRPLQTIDFRITDKHKSKALGIDTTWNTTGGRVQSRGKPTTLKNALSAATVASASSVSLQRVMSVTDTNELDKEEELRLEQEMRDRLQFKIPPNKLQTHYQLNNIAIREIEQVINRSQPSSYNTKCDKSCGWILSKDFAKIREIMDRQIDVWIEHKKKQKTGKVKDRNSKQKDDELQSVLDPSILAVLTGVSMSTSASSASSTSESGGSSSPNIHEDEDEKRMELEDDTEQNEADASLFANDDDVDDKTNDSALSETTSVPNVIITTNKADNNEDEDEEVSPASPPATPSDLDADARKQRGGDLRSKVVQELVSTEKTYVSCLDNLIRHFMMPLQNKINGTLLLSRTEHATIFPADINTIYGFHTQLLVELAKTTANWDNDTSKIGNIFVKYGQLFKMYQNYMNNHEKAASCLSATMSKNTKFAEWSVKQRAKCNNYTLSSLLILPIQRIPRYQLMLKELIKRTEQYDAYHCDLYDLRNAYDQITEVAQIINERMKENDRRQKVGAIESRFDRSLTDKLVDGTLVDPARYFIAKSSDDANDPDCIIKHNKHGSQRHIVVFVFNDCLIYGHYDNSQVSTKAASASTPSASSSSSIVSHHENENVSSISSTSSITKSYTVRNLFKGRDLLRFDHLMSFDELFRLEDVAEHQYNGLFCLKIYARQHSLWVSFKSKHAKFEWMTLLTQVNEKANSRAIKVTSPDASAYNIDIAYPVFIPDDYSDKCMLCNGKFTLLNRRHHCYYCGSLACAKCTEFRLNNAWKQNEIVRVCQHCQLSFVLRCKFMSCISVYKYIYAIMIYKTCTNTTLVYIAHSAKYKHRTGNVHAANLPYVDHFYWIYVDISERTFYVDFRSNHK